MYIQYEKLFCISDLVSSLTKPKFKEFKARVEGLYVYRQQEIRRDHYCKRLRKKKRELLTN